MARNFANGLILLACSLGLTAPALAEVAAATPAASAPAATTPAAATPAAATQATAAPATAAPATAAPAATTTSTSSATSTTTKTDSGASQSATTSATQSSTATTAADGSSTTTTSTKESKETKETKPAEPAINYAQTYLNAAKSETILTAEYLDYDRTSPDVRWNQPVKAYYQITRILKGPPLNHRLPIKYEFHDRSNPPAPAGWKFSAKEMPAPGSKWLIFIEHSVPHNNQFETYEGSWGRQPMTEENLNKVYQLLNTSGEAGY